MATITFDTKDLVEESGVGDLDSAINKIGMEIKSEEIGEISIDITPNRPDLLDITGLGRTLGNITGKRIREGGRYVVRKEPITEVKVGRGVKDVRPFISAVVAKGIDLKGNRLRYLINFTNKIADTYGRRRKKIAVGIHDFDKIKGPLVYDARAEGKIIPLGDSEEMGFGNVMSMHAKGREYHDAIAMEGKKPNRYPMISDAEKTIALVPIINSAGTAVTESTRNILVEVTGTSEKGIGEIADLLACSFMDGGAEVYPVNISYEGRNKTITPGLKYREVTIRMSAIDKTVGLHIDGNEIVRYANMTGYTASKHGKAVTLNVPPYRTDFLNEQDAIDDIVMAYGYENINPAPIAGHSIGVPHREMERSNSLAEFAIGLGFTEAFNQYLTNENNEFVKMRRKYDEKKAIRTAYSKTESLNMLRSSVLPSLLQNLGISSHEKLPQMLFEIGSVFSIDGGKVSEKTSMALVSEHAKADFSEIKGYVVSLLERLEINAMIKEHQDGAFIEGRCAAVVRNGAVIGVFGEVHPEVLANFKLEEPVVAGEISFGKAGI